MSAEDEGLLQELGRFVRTTERDPDAKRLEGFCRGDLSSQQREELEAAAAADPALARAMDAHAPLSEDTRSRTAEQVLAALQKAEPRGVAPASKGRHSRVARVIWLAAPVAAAAAAVLWFATQTQVAPIPGYALEVSGGQAEVRSETSSGSVQAPIRIGPNTRLQLVLRPTSATGSDVTAAAFLMRPDGAPAEWQGELIRAESGAMKLVLSVPPVELTDAAEVRVVVGRTELISEGALELARSERESGPGFQRFQLRVVPGAR